MNKKVLIVDDKPDRMKSILGGYFSEIEKLENEGLLTIATEIANLDVALMDYALLAVHLSYLKEKNLYNDFLSKAKAKDVILFSGGESRSSLENAGRRLLIMDTEFYTRKLGSFLRDYYNDSLKNPFLQFLYGSQWKMALLLKYRYLLWKYGNNDLEFVDLSDDEYDFVENEAAVLWQDGVAPTKVSEIDVMIDELSMQQGI